MYRCQCGAPVRAIYCPDENQFEPDEVCEECYIEEKIFDEEIKQALILEKREEMKKRTQEFDTLEELPF